MFYAAKYNGFTFLQVKFKTVMFEYYFINPLEFTFLQVKIKTFNPDGEAINNSHLHSYK